MGKVSEKLGDWYDSTKEYVKDLPNTLVSDDPSEQTAPAAVDITDGLRNNKGYVLMFHHVPSGAKLYFKGFLTGYSEQFTSNWTNETVYGRMDDIYTFQNTKRQIKVSFVVPAFDYDDAKDNLTNVSELTRMLYPAYTAQEDHKVSNEPNRTIYTLNSAPLIRLQFVNLIQSSNGNSLLGKMNGLSYTPNLDNGFFDKPMELLPKTIDIDFTFDVLHEHVLGWSPSAWMGTSVFPYMPSSIETAKEDLDTAIQDYMAAPEGAENDAAFKAMADAASALEFEEGSAARRDWVSPEDAQADQVGIISTS
jgi:hypothetical protein